MQLYLYDLGTVDGWDIGQGFEIEGEPPVNRANRPSAHYQIVGAEYFDVLGIPLLQGRAFTEHDRAGAAPVCIVNEEFVRRYLSGRSPVGTRVHGWGRWFTIVGVSRDNTRRVDSIDAQIQMPSAKKSGAVPQR